MVSDAQSAGGNSQEETLADLQMRLTYQEEEILHLNQALERQRMELDYLKREITQLKRLIASLTPPEAGNREDETPPHY